MKKKGLFLILILIFCLLTGCAEENSSSIYDFSNKQPEEIDPWVYIADRDVTQNEAMRGVASSSAELGMTIGITGIVCSFIYMAIRIMFTTDPKKREEIKQEAIIKGVIGIMLFCVPLILSIFKLFGDSFV